jgi:hypothetical protein
MYINALDSAKLLLEALTAALLVLAQTWSHAGSFKEI